MTHDQLEELHSWLTDECAAIGQADTRFQFFLQSAVAIRSLLAQEPVAWVDERLLEVLKESGELRIGTTYRDKPDMEDFVPLYAAPIPAVAQAARAAPAQDKEELRRFWNELNEGAAPATIPELRAQLDAAVNAASRAAPAQPTRSQKLAAAGFTRRPTTLETQLRDEDAAPAQEVSS